MSDEKTPILDGELKETTETDTGLEEALHEPETDTAPAEADEPADEAQPDTESPAEEPAPGENKFDAAKAAFSEKAGAAKAVLGEKAGAAKAVLGEKAGVAKEKLAAVFAKAKEGTEKTFAKAKEGTEKTVDGLKDRMEARSSSTTDAAKKKKKRKNQKQRAAAKPYVPTIEDELADLAAEEAAFDEWGRPIRRKRRKKRRKSRMLSCTLVLLTLILAMSSVLSVTILAVAKEMYGIDKNVDKRPIVIPAGATVNDITQQLVDEGMVSLPTIFRIVSRMNGKDGEYIAGEHVLSASMSYEAMIEELCTNYEEKREYVRVTIREGMTLLDAAKLLQENEVCNGQDFRFYFNAGNYGYNFEKYLPQSTNPLKFQRMEGYCFPDTYEFYVGEDPNIVAQKIYANFDSKMTDGDYRKMQERGMTLDEVITLASIVQGEAPSSDSMKMVASVFHNRLLNKSVFPQLQSDPTRKYAEDVIAPNLQMANELMTTAYNTYAGQGLPPGAINNPGREAIEATLYPADTGYYFFNANINTGEIFYAVTYAEHQNNLEKVKQQYAAAEAAANGRT